MKHKKLIILTFVFFLVILLINIIWTSKSNIEEVSTTPKNDIEQNIITESENVIDNIIQEDSQKDTKTTNTEEYKTITKTMQNEKVSSTSKINEAKVTQTETKEKPNNKESIENTETKTQEQIINKEEKKPEKVVTFKQNDIYIQKIRNYLTTHESEDMKQYGYNIKINSDIVSQTTGFTYSELNMSGYTNKAGTIKIYARDYFLNGNYIETQCFVL